jgi:hypothetical protein
MKKLNADIPQVTWDDVTRVWQILWNSVVGNPNILFTRKEFDKAEGIAPVPALTVTGCMRIYADFSLIKCIGDNGVISQPDKESDYLKFRLTGKGCILGNLLTRDNIK